MTTVYYPLFKRSFEMMVYTQNQDLVCKEDKKGMPLPYKPDSVLATMWQCTIIYLTSPGEEPPLRDGATNTRGF